MWKIMIIKVGDIQNNGPIVQQILTDFRCCIKTRLGLHEAGDVCGADGVIILRLCGEKEESMNLEATLNDLPKVQAETVTFE